MLNIHRYVSKCRGIDINNPSIERSIEPFMMFESLAYMTTDDIHSNVISWGNRIFVVRLKYF